MNPFQQLLNTVRSGYRKADAAAGGWLPGGGVPNPLSKTLSTFNPQDIAAYGVSSATTPIQQRLSKFLQQHVESSSWGKNLREVPSLMEAANQEMQKIGRPGTWSTDFKTMRPSNLGQGNLPSGVQVDASKGGMYSFMGPHFTFQEGQGGIVRLSPNTPSWIAAHELGHAIDFYKNPKSFEYTNPSNAIRHAKNVAMQQASPGAFVLGLGGMRDEKDRSLLQAGIEGAFTGLGANQQILKHEIQADRYGIPLARTAGVRWNTPANIAAKGTYVASSMFPGFSQGIIAEFLNRGVDTAAGLSSAAMRAAKGTSLSPTEKALEQYGYNPADYGMTMNGNEIRLNKRTEAEKSLYNYIIDPNKKLAGGY